ncbi:hypothetical protein KO317_04305 [Candidatus Micrarchaeota archaeon]|jgi:hypothetical protein|nr:hypothetical protein [Candidatus Micrarchaeota archaeon]
MAKKIVKKPLKKITKPKAKPSKKELKNILKPVSSPKSKKVKPNVRKSLDSLKDDIYGIKAMSEEDTPEKRKIQLQTITYELAAIKNLMSRVSTQLKIIEDHIEEIKSQ